MQMARDATLIGARIAATSLPVVISALTVTGIVAVTGLSIYVYRRKATHTVFHKSNASSNRRLPDFQTASKYVELINTQVQ